MTPLAQIRANMADSKISTWIGIVLIVAGILCDAGVVAHYYPDAAEVWCAAVSKMAIYIGGGTAIMSRGFLTPPR